MMKEKVYFNRTEVSDEVLQLRAKVSVLTKQLNSLSVSEMAKKQEIIREIFGSVGSRQSCESQEGYMNDKNNGHYI